MQDLVPIIGIIVVALVEIGVFCRFELKGDVKFDYTQGKDLERLFVFLPGLLAGGVENSDVFYPTMVENGCVLQVSPVGARFREKEIVKLTKEWLKRYHKRHRPHNFEVVFVGSSLGGDLAYDIYVKLPRRWRRRGRFSFVVIDSPVGRQDLQQPARMLSRVVGLMRPFTFPLGWIKVNGFSLTYWADQIYYLSNHQPLKGLSLQDCTVVFVKSIHDKLVSYRSIDSWMKAAGYGMYQAEAFSTHAGYHEVPYEWKGLFEIIMPYVC